MRASSVLFLLFAFVTLKASHGAPPVRCPGAANAGCKAFSFLNILVSAGRCYGEASADCKAVSESQSQFNEAYNEWFGEEGACDEGKAEAAATAVATAVAKVWSNAAVKVTCDGLGFACGWTISNGNTFALGFAEALAQAAADAGAGEAAEGFCYADVRGLASAFASAASQAQADACSTGETVEDFENSYVEAVKVGVANAFVSATASACSANETVAASSKCFGDATSETEEAIAKKGDACGGVARLKTCDGTGALKCCSSDFRRSLCTCKDCNGPWVRRSKRNAAKKTFMNRSGELCFCKDAKDDSVDELTPEDLARANFSSSGDIDIPKTGIPDFVGSGNDTEVLEQSESVSISVGEKVDAESLRCPGAVDTNCKAFSFLEILVTAGSCSGTASADCKAVTESQNDFKTAYDEWWGEEGVCDEGKAVAAATATSKAIAKVWANAAVKVTCEGSGFACGWSNTNGEAWALGFAEALAQAAAEASSTIDGDSEGFCYADIRSVSTVIAEAAATAQADACTTNGTVESFENSYAAAIEVGIARAFAQATAQACSDDGDLIASSRCVGDAQSDTESDTFVAGNACAGIAQVGPCKGVGKDVCCDPGYKRRLCTCNKGSKKCTNGPWLRKSKFSAEKNTKLTYEDRKGNLCFCLE